MWRRYKYMIGALNNKLSSKSRMPPMPGKKFPESFTPASRLNKRFNQVTHHGADAQDDSENHCVNPGHSRKLIAEEMRKEYAGQVDTTIAPPKPSQVLPGLMRGIILCLPISEPTA